jgi:predicted transcriptional regulator
VYTTPKQLMDMQMDNNNTDAVHEEKENDGAMTLEHLTAALNAAKAEVDAVKAVAKAEVEAANEMAEAAKAEVEAVKAVAKAEVEAVKAVAKAEVEAANEGGNNLGPGSAEALVPPLKTMARCRC